MSGNYSIEARGTATEYYDVQADSEDEARAIFERGDAGDAIYSEVDASEVVRIERVS